MGYDYSLRFLKKHEDSVERIVQISTSGELLTYEGDWKQISDRQMLVNNLIASIARNIEGMSDIRQKVRSWTQYDESKGVYRLFIGIPEHKMGGRPPGYKRMPWMDNYVSTAQVGSSKYEHPNMLNSEEELLTFVGKVVSLSGIFKTATVEVADLTDESVVEYFSSVFTPYGWSARRDGKLLILERP